MKFFKFLFVFIGGILIGFGIGLIIGKNLLFTDTTFWSSVISSLVLGGFLMALGLAIRGRKKEKKEPSSAKAAEGKEEISGPTVPPVPPAEQNPPNF